MQCKSIEDLRDEGLPATMPSATELGVWKRSTGYEVILPYRLGWLNWLFFWTGLVGLVGSIFLVARKFEVADPMNQAVIYTALVVPVLAYMLFLSFKLSQTRSTKIRIDMTPVKMTFTMVEPSGVTKKFGEIPVNEIENVCMEIRRGVRINWRVGDELYHKWTGRGLKADDLYYLACVIGQITNLSIQNGRPMAPKMKGFNEDDIGHIELG